jgi:hypothetical protein
MTPARSLPVAPARQWQGGFGGALVIYLEIAFA